MPALTINSQKGGIVMVEKKENPTVAQNKKALHDYFVTNRNCLHDALNVVIAVRTLIQNIQC